MVYSTEWGRVNRQGSMAKRDGNRQHRSQKVHTPQDGTIRIRREVKGRRGKQVTVVDGFAGGADGLKRIATHLKRICGSGGSIKDNCVIIQGDHRKRVQAELVKQGYPVKLAGG
jgi:translation initiation factor 1